MNEYRINEQTGEIYKYEEEERAFLFFGKVVNFTEQEIKEMINSTYINEEE